MGVLYPLDQIKTIMQGRNYGPNLEYVPDASNV
jgi:hypothetical protein